MQNIIGKAVRPIDSEGYKYSAQFRRMSINHLYGGMDEPELKIIDVFICKLRKKLGEATDGENYIETVWGRGYVLRDPEPAMNAEKIAIGA
jgi:two-component system cell cycle response regulator CtrA